MNFAKITLATAALAFSSLAAQAADLSGAGATFPYPVYAKWADAYKKETGVGLNYQSIGSGGGIKQIKAKTVTFGASDAPLPGKELDESGLAQFPMVMGGIVPVVNIEGVKPGDLVLDGPTIARIFLGRLGHDLQFQLLPVRGEPRLEVEGRHQHGGAMAGRHRRQGQRRRRQQRRPDQGLDRLCRICLRQAEQADLSARPEQGAPVPAA